MTAKIALVSDNINAVEDVTYRASTRALILVGHADLAGTESCRRYAIHIDSDEGGSVHLVFRDKFGYRADEVLCEDCGNPMTFDSVEVARMAVSEIMAAYRDEYESTPWQDFVAKDEEKEEFAQRWRLLNRDLINLGLDNHGGHRLEVGCAVRFWHDDSCVLTLVDSSGHVVVSDLPDADGGELIYPTAADAQRAIDKFAKERQAQREQSVDEEEEQECGRGR